MNELKLIEKIAGMAHRAQPARRNAGLVVGIGDDCAIFRPRAGEDLLFKADQIVEDVHFRRTMNPAIIGQRALARGLSDIAAMGGTPRLCLVSLTVPRDLGARFILAFYRGLLAEARRARVLLAGGDMAHGDKIYCDVSICGAVATGKALRRDGARPGDLLYVSGPLGKPWNKRIEPRLSLGRKLLGKATACMDLSDGLALDLHRLCMASGVSAEVDRVPVHRGATLDRALHGGEDYELLFTMPPYVKPLAGVTRIGTVLAATRGRKAGQVSLQGEPLAPEGYDHFDERRVHRDVISESHGYNP